MTSVGREFVRRSSGSGARSRGEQDWLGNLHGAQNSQFVRSIAAAGRRTVVEIGHLPHYNQDLVESPPPSFTEFRERIKSVHAVLFVTPEYNRSVPGVLKNALDIGSRSYGRSTWDGKTGAVVSTSIGPLGGFGANHHLRQSLVRLNVSTMAQPEAYIGSAHSYSTPTENSPTTGRATPWRSSCRRSRHGWLRMRAVDRS